MTTTPQPTPETDAESINGAHHPQFVLSDFARKLERERDEALVKLSTVNRWVEKNLSGGFIDSLTHLQNLECVADDWYGRLVETIRERDEAREQLQAMREVIAAAEKCRHWHDCSYNEDTGKTEGVIISAESFWSLQNALAKLQTFIKP